MVRIQVRSVLFFAASRARMRSGDQFSVCIELLLFGLKKKKKKPKKCGFALAGTRGEWLRRAPVWFIPQFPLTL